MFEVPPTAKYRELEWKSIDVTSYDEAEDSAKVNTSVFSFPLVITLLLSKSSSFTWPKTAIFSSTSTTRPSLKPSATAWSVLLHSMHRASAPLVVVVVVVVVVAFVDRRVALIVSARRLSSNASKSSSSLDEKTDFDAIFKLPTRAAPRSSYVAFASSMEKIFISDRPRDDHPTVANMVVVVVVVVVLYGAQRSFAVVVVGPMNNFFMSIFFLKFWEKKRTKVQNPKPHVFVFFVHPL